MIKTFYIVRNVDNGEFFIGRPSSFPSYGHYKQQDKKVPYTKKTFTNDIEKAKIYPTVKSANNAADNLQNDYDRAIRNLKRRIDWEYDAINNSGKPNYPYHNKPLTPHEVDEAKDLINLLDDEIVEIMNSRPNKIEVCTVKASCTIT